MLEHKDQLRRDMLNNPGIYQSVIDRIEECVSTCIHVSDMPNAVYDVTDFHNAMVGASIRNGQVAGCAESARRIHGEKRHPTGEWMRHIASKSQLDQIMGCFEELVSMNISLLHRTGILKEDKALDAAIDMHLIPRYDKEYGEELVRSKSKSGTFVFERYITIQCVVSGLRLVLGVLHMPALEDTADFVRKLVESAQDTGITLGTIMMDREFFSTGVMSMLNEIGVQYLMPCKNTGTVVDAIGEFAAGKRPKESQCVLSGTGGDVPYTIIITKRKKRKKKSNEKPHERYIGFATNVPGIDVDKYARRWGIETGYRIIQSIRIKTHSKNPAARLLCFVYSVCIFNAWVMANAMLNEKEYGEIPMQYFTDMLEWCIQPDYVVEPEPPPLALR